MFIRKVPFGGIHAFMWYIIMNRGNFIHKRFILLGEVAVKIKSSQF